MICLQLLNASTHLGQNFMSSPDSEIYFRVMSYWLCGGFLWPAAAPVPCCSPVHTRCPSAASPRFLHPGWLLPAACAGSATHAHTPRPTHTHTHSWCYRSSLSCAHEPAALSEHTTLPFLLLGNRFHPEAFTSAFVLSSGFSFNLTHFHQSVTR